MYTSWQQYYGATPLLFAPLASSLFTSFFTPLYLLGNPPCCDRIPSTLVPGYSWTDHPFLNPSPFPPHSKFQVPRLIVRNATTTSWSRLLMSGTITMKTPSVHSMYITGGRCTTVLVFEGLQDPLQYIITKWAVGHFKYHVLQDFKNVQTKRIVMMSTSRSPLRKEKTSEVYTVQKISAKISWHCPFK
jgi:hypothetical protein